MSILIPGTEKLAETVDIAVKWGSATLTGKIVPAGTPLTAEGEAANIGTSKAAAVRGITAIDYGYSPYSNSCPCIVAGVVDMTKVKFRGYKDPICAALDQISFIDANKNVYHPSVVSQIEDGSITARQLAPGLLPTGAWATLYEGAWDAETGELDPGVKAGTFFIPSGLEEDDWATFVSSINNPCVGATPSQLFSINAETEAITVHGGLKLYYRIVGETIEPVQVYADTSLSEASEYIMADPPESGE